MGSGWPWAFYVAKAARAGEIRGYAIMIPKGKMTGREKKLRISIGRPPEQHDLADRLRAFNFTYKFCASISEERLAEIEIAEAKRILQDAGAADERFRIRTADEYGGNVEWHARRMRYKYEALHMELIRAEGERIIGQQQPRRDLVQVLSGGLHRMERRYYENITNVIGQTTRNYLFSSGSRDALNACLQRSLGGHQQHVNLLLDLRSPDLENSFNRETDIVIVYDGRPKTELHGYHMKLTQLRAIVKYVNVLTYQVYQYIDNMIENNIDWSCVVDGRVLSRIVPPGGRIYRMKYGTSTNKLVLKRVHYAADVPAACGESGFIYKFYTSRRESAMKKRRRSRD